MILSFRVAAEREEQEVLVGQEESHSQSSKQQAKSQGTHPLLLQEEWVSESDLAQAQLVHKLSQMGICPQAAVGTMTSQFWLWREDWMKQTKDPIFQLRA